MIKAIVAVVCLLGCYEVHAKCTKKIEEQHLSHREIKTAEGTTVTTFFYECPIRSNQKKKFDVNQLCTYCGCQKSDHDNE